jgi:membrane protein implicated in regulation of membrane protease activity
LEYALAAAVLVALVAAVVVRPLLQRVEERPPDEGRREELEAAKEAKYREIRDAELDRDMGKLSQPDWREIDRELRSEAMQILQRLDDLGEPSALP